jgi:hypothetical protein
MQVTDMTGDLWAAVTTLAADNARMCDIIIAADKLRAAAKALVQDANRSVFTNLRAALDNFDAVRGGQ